MSIRAGFESYSRTSPLILRFQDAATGAVVSRGLSVSAYPPGASARRVSLAPNSRGIFTARGLAGLREIEAGTGDDAYWASVAVKRRFLVEVVDAQGRYLPTRFEADLPARGVFSPGCLASSPPASSDSAFVPLYPAANFPTSVAFAAIRAELQDTKTGGPASWAVIRASSGDGRPPVVGVADGAGKLLLLMPYPAPGVFVPDSPVASRRPIVGESWPITITAAYSPTRPRPTIPDFCATLAQTSATLWANAARTVSLGTAQLTFGRDLILRSGPGAPTLLVTTL